MHNILIITPDSFEYLSNLGRYRCFNGIRWELAKTVDGFDGTSKSQDGNSPPKPGRPLAQSRIVGGGCLQTRMSRFPGIVGMLIGEYVMYRKICGEVSVIWNVLYYRGLLNFWGG